LPPIFSNFNNDTTQQGTNLIWTHNLAPSATLNLSLTAYQSKANGPPAGTTNYGSINLFVTSPVSARTTVFAGARYQISRSDIAVDYNEAAIFAGLTYTYK
jgi:uncharacterized protein (PEP-CTERM system associated)